MSGKIEVEPSIRRARAAPAVVGAAASARSASDETVTVRIRRTKKLLFGKRVGARPNSGGRAEVAQAYKAESSLRPGANPLVNNGCPPGENLDNAGRLSVANGGRTCSGIVNRDCVSRVAL